MDASTENLSLVLTPFDRRIERCAEKLTAFRAQDDGYAYLQHTPATPLDLLLPEDLAVTLAFNSRATGRAFKSLMRHGSNIDLSVLPTKSLQETTSAERDVVAALIAEIATWPGFGASLATKTLHKKRPTLIPVLDNRAIFEAFLDSRWPSRRTVGESVRNSARIRTGLERLYEDLVRPENSASWQALAAVDPNLTQIEILDMVWWMHFRSEEAVKVPPVS